MNTSHPPFDDARFRQVLGHFSTGVSVITSTFEGAPVGLAVGSFASLSLDPPLVLFCPGNQSSSWPKIRESGTFCVNILSAGQEHVCRVFASKEPDKFAAIGWEASPITGAPRVTGVLAWIDCEIEAIHPGGDHEIVVGRVRDLDASDEHGPLVFYRGGYGRLEV